MSVLVSGRDVTGKPLGDGYRHSPVDGYDAETIAREREASRLAHSKPYYHLTAPQGWSNDPCGLGFDPTTGLYNLFFQWNPYGNDWGNMSWGHATSTDLVSWKVSPHPALTPSTEYDCRGIFTGCLQATDIHGNPGALTVAYTSVKHLPIHFTLPYTTGCESLSLVVSKDGGKTWKRQDCNPILTGPPADLKVTGWRDPCITTWARRSSSPPQLHGFISGGLVGQTPSVFVYTINPQDLREWQYAGLLVDVGLNFRPSRWCHDFGVNWEVSNMMTLINESGESRDFVVMGVEGCLRPEGSDLDVDKAHHRRDPRAQSWMSVKVPEDSDKYEALTRCAFAGTFDHGCLYAANSFWDPQSSQRIFFGWITEEDLPDGPRHRQGWSGMISLPRVVKLFTLRKVRNARRSPLHSIGCIEMLPEVSGKETSTIHTLGISPDPRLSRLRYQATHHNLPVSSMPLVLHLTIKPCLPVTTVRWELLAEFAVNQCCERVGIEIAHSAGELFSVLHQIMYTDIW